MAEPESLPARGPEGPRASSLHRVVNGASRLPLAHRSGNDPGHPPIPIAWRQAVADEYADDGDNQCTKCPRPQWFVTIPGSENDKWLRGNMG
jgi:hypothetical protein